ncbi:hypothetical protein STEG23_032953, partial [Scotinomys teguina]
TSGRQLSHFEKDHWLHCCHDVTGSLCFLLTSETPYSKCFWTTKFLISATDEHCQ